MLHKRSILRYINLKALNIVLKYIMKIDDIFVILIYLSIGQFGNFKANVP